MLPTKEVSWEICVAVIDVTLTQDQKTEIKVVTYFLCTVYLNDADCSITFVNYLKWHFYFHGTKVISIQSLILVKIHVL